MKKLSVAVFLCLGVFAPGLFALDLTPEQIPVTEAGPPVQRYFFRDGARRLTFRIDNQMMVSGASNSALFRFRDLRTAGMKISKSPLPPALLFDVKNAEKYLSAARACLPPDAVTVQLEAETPNAIAINGWTSHQYTFTYTLFDVPSRSTVTFINFSPTEQIVFSVGAATTDYGKAYGRSYRVLNSVGEMKTDDPIGPT